jgi:hypothetical protein
MRVLSHAFEAAQTVSATAITIASDEVVLDLNGRNLWAAGAATASQVGIGIAVLNQQDCIIQDGDVSGFGNVGILLDATDNARAHNQKNEVLHVNL